MSDLSINFNEVTPEQVKEKIDYFMNLLKFLKVLNVPQINIVVEFLEKVMSKEVTAKAIALVFEIIATDWQFKELIADLKGV